MSVLVETEQAELVHTKQRIGLDLGIKDLCITSEGKKFRAKGTNYTLNVFKLKTIIFRQISLLYFYNYREGIFNYGL